MYGIRWQLFCRKLVLAGLIGVSGCESGQPGAFQGYVEGDYLYLASPRAGFLAELKTDRGSHVDAGVMVFAVDDALERYELNEAQAQTASAQNKITNLKEPRRRPEIGQLQAQLAAFEANLRLSELQFKRAANLFAKGSMPKADFDKAKAERDKDAAQVEAARKQLDTFQSAFGRRPEIESAQAELKAAGARVQQKQWQVDNTSVYTPSPGVVTETYYRPGEWVPADKPVLSFLPDDRRRIRFFVPEAELAHIRLGQKIETHCDGCNDTVTATVTFIAPQAEYTPPVIYSRENRAKLVFRVEAEPIPNDARRLHPGLPVTVNVNAGG